MYAKTMRFSSYGQAISGNNGHPQKVMKDLGITYKSSEPQPIADQWLFHDCEYDCKLPKYITDIEKEN